MSPWKTVALGTAACNTVPPHGAVERRRVAGQGYTDPATGIAYALNEPGTARPHTPIN